MAVSASGLLDDVIAAFPAEWNWDDWSSIDPGLPSNPPNRVWLEALCTGFVSMWQAGVLSPGLGPPPAGSYPHPHTLTTLVSSTMIASLPAYTADATMVANAIANGTVTHLLANTVIAVADGAATHKHSFTGFGLEASLVSTILGLVTFPSPSTSFQQYLDGFATGLLGHLGSNADMAVAVGTGHVHTLL
jgi:hypothetical protein